MQAVIAIPELPELRKYLGGKEFLTREVAGVPLLIRVLATAVRAGVDSLLVIWPENTDRAICKRCVSSPLLRGVKVRELITSRPFDPRQTASWNAVADSLEDQFLWLPWNWVTHKRALAEISLSPVLPAKWDAPVLISRRAAVHSPRIRVVSRWNAEGVSVTSLKRIATAERFLVAHSGKPSDGIYSKFNRLLCRPWVRWLAHTRVTPNWVTLAGLAVAVLAAFFYARGLYASYVAGALLFFVSGLFDEIDGMLARIKFRESAFGTWFEGFVDNATYLLLFAGMTIGLYRQRGRAELIYGLALIIGCVLSVVAVAWQRKMSTAPERPHEYAGQLNRLLETDSNVISKVVRQIHIFIKKGVAIHYVLIFTVAGGLPLFLRLAAIAANLTWILVLYFNRRFFRNRDFQSTVEDLSKAA
ncbi:MAG TPA: CDP-alcohol phosphatidyltransferase family protein [Bryobacteraceae bacterium]|nr:CDP-alcohol phosphatidyltransferase family protein [Bryobacteraceae bacterium]